MPTAARTGPGRPPKPAAIRRSEWIRVRVTPGEKAAGEARAEANHMGFSEYARLQVCGSAPEQLAEQVRNVDRRQKAEQRAPGDLEAIKAQIRRETPGLPERSVGILAARRLQQG